jgi:hypothetical protein
MLQSTSVETLRSPFLGSSPPCSNHVVTYQPLGIPYPGSVSHDLVSKKHSGILFCHVASYASSRIDKALV